MDNGGDYIVGDGDHIKLAVGNNIKFPLLIGHPAELPLLVNYIKLTNYH